MEVGGSEGPVKEIAVALLRQMVSNSLPNRYDPLQE